MDESTKTKLHLTNEERAVLRGRILDIGAGEDPVTPQAEPFDLAHGDANHITAFPPESFDCVYSSHCLEHMHDPHASLANWWSLVKPGGHLFVVVPDEDLYEQGRFPSRFNSDHKATFTISKKRSWSPRTHNLLDMCLALPGAQLRSIRLNDIGYDRAVAHHGPPMRWPLRRVLAQVHRGLRKAGLLPRSINQERLLAMTRGVDQTRGDALAQIEAIVRKLP